MRKFTIIGIAAIVTGILVGVVIASSGDDGNGSSQATTQELEPLPGSATGGSRTSTDRTTTTDKTNTDSGSGGSTAPTQPPAQPDSSGGATTPQDTEQNDTPPPSGSPAEKFEKFCEQNPGAC